VVGCKKRVEGGGSKERHKVTLRRGDKGGGGTAREGRKEGKEKGEDTL